MHDVLRRSAHFGREPVHLFRTFRFRRYRGRNQRGRTSIDNPMTPSVSSELPTKLILRGIHVHLTAAMKAALETKTERLFRHEPRIVRLRVDVHRELRGRSPVFVAKGQIEIAGPDLSASVNTENAYASINLLIDKLDRMLRRRITSVLRRRSADDIRAHVTSE